VYKIGETAAKAVFVDRRTPELVALKTRFPQLLFYNASEIHQEDAIQDLFDFIKSQQKLPISSSIRCTIFTSGTTGMNLIHSIFKLRFFEFYWH